MAQYEDHSAINSFNSFEIIQRTMKAQLMKIYRSGLESIAGDYATYIILSYAMIQSPNRRMAEAMIWGAPKMTDVDSQGEITSHGQMSQSVVGLTLGKKGAILDIQDIDFVNLSNVGEMVKIMRVVSASAIQGVVDQASFLLNNLSTGLYKTYNNETPAMLTRSAGSLFLNGSDNLAQNMGALAWSPDNLLASLTKIDTHQTIDLTSIPSNLLGIIVDASKYQQVMNDLKNTYFSGSENYQRYWMSNIPMVGKVKFTNPATWLVITSASQIGWAVYSGFILPSIFLTKDPVNENVKVVTKWYNQPFCLSPWGFYLNLFT